MRLDLLHEIAIFQTVKSKVIVSLFETLRNLYKSLNSIKERTAMCRWRNFHSFRKKNIDVFLGFFVK